jgi:hypothetical protein
VSLELDLIVAPRATYAALLSTPSTPTPRTPRTPSTLCTLLRRPLLVAVVIGVSLALASTRRLSPELVVSTTLTWSYLVVFQVLVAAALIARGARRTVGFARAMDLFFAGHAPWSLFLLATAAWGPTAGGRPAWPVTVAVLVPLVLTPRIVAAFFSEVLHNDRRDSRRLTIAQQAITWTAFVALNWIASAVTPRLFELRYRW